MIDRAKLSAFNDVDLLSLVGWGEARGEPIESQLGVMCVVRNRAVRGGWFGEGYSGAILHRAQFSCLNPDDVNCEQVLNLAERLRDALAIGEQPISQIWWLANGVIMGHMQDITLGATHYFADTIPVPGWAAGHKPTVKLGHHVFYSL